MLTLVESRIYALALVLELGCMHVYLKHLARLLIHRGEHFRERERGAEKGTTLGGGIEERGIQIEFRPGALKEGRENVPT